jgi:hypothetical protein
LDNWSFAVKIFLALTKKSSGIRHLLAIEKCNGMHFLKGIEACTTGCGKTASSSVVGYYLLKY